MYKRPSYLLQAVAIMLANSGASAALNDPIKQPVTARFAHQVRQNYLRNRSRNYGRGSSAHVRPDKKLPEIQQEIIQSAIDKRSRRGLRLCAEGR